MERNSSRASEESPELGGRWGEWDGGREWRSAGSGVVVMSAKKESLRSSPSCLRAAKRAEARRTGRGATTIGRVSFDMADTERKGSARSPQSNHII